MKVVVWNLHLTLGVSYMNRLKQKELADYRYDLWCEQSHICPLCHKQIEKEDAVLDHCHATGHIRRVLHRACNAQEARVINQAYRSKADDPFLFIANIIEYYKKDYSDMPIHPTHLTGNEKELKRLRKHQRKLKTQKGRDKYQVRIDALIQMIEEENKSDR